MTKSEHIDYWIKSAEFDYDVFNTLYSNGKYVHAMFIAHLMIEKIIKAHWVKDNETSFPPKVHNLIFLLRQTKLDLSVETLVFVLNLMIFRSRVGILIINLIYIKY
ncbi:MAG: hypothetical protein HW421_114 [Ignavibacteria bacterium]|nr:hypothetical protein [Ignavibacteria bacterium]